MYPVPGVGAAQESGNLVQGMVEFCLEFSFVFCRTVEGGLNLFMAIGVRFLPHCFPGASADCVM